MKSSSINQQNFSPKMMDNMQNPKKDIMNNPMIDNMNNPMIDDMKNPMKDNMNNPMINNYLNNMNNPMMDNNLNNMNNPMMDNMKNPMMDNNLNNMNNPMMYNMMKNDNLQNIMKDMLSNFQILNNNMKQFSNHDNEENEKIITVIFRTQNNYYLEGKLISIQCNLEDKVSDVIRRYRNKTGHFEERYEKFIYNASKLNENKSVIENGICNNSVIFVISTKAVIGAS